MQGRTFLASSGAALGFFGLQKYLTEEHQGKKPHLGGITPDGKIHTLAITGPWQDHA